VLADDLSAAAIVEAVRNGRTVVKLQGGGDPMIEFSSSVAPQGDTVHARSTILSAKVTGGLAGAASVHFVKNGEDQAEVPVTSDPFVHEARIAAPDQGEDRWRVEVLLDGTRHTVTSHLFVQRDPTGPDPLAPADASSDGGCHTGKVASSSAFVSSIIAAMVVFFARRRRG